MILTLLEKYYPITKATYMPNLRLGDSHYVASSLEIVVIC